MTLAELLEKKRNAVAAYRAELEDAEKTNRPVDQGKSDAWEKEIEDADTAIKTIETDKATATRRRDFLAGAERSLRQPVLAGTLQPRGTDGASLQPDNRSAIERYRDATARGMSRTEAIAAIAGADDDRAEACGLALRQYLSNGHIESSLRQRAGLQMDSDVAGGYLVIPEVFVARLIQDLDRVVFMRGLATIFPLANGESLGAPSLDTDISDAEWTTELQTGTLDTALQFGKRRLTPHPLAKRILVSKDLMRAAALSPEAIVRERMAYKFGTVEENAFMTGSGAAQPLGVFTAHADGISTARDVSTDNTTTALTADGLINAKYALEAQWLMNPNLRWIFHRNVVRDIRKLKDGNGVYIWQPGLLVDRGDRILDVPLIMSEFAPSTMTAGQYVGIIGDFSYYWIVDSFGLEIQRLVELYAATNQDGFHGRRKLDGAPVLEKAFARVQLASA